MFGWIENTYKKDWFNDKFRESIEKRATLRYNIIRNSSNENKKEYEQGRKENHATLRKDKIIYMTKIITKIEIEENIKKPKTSL